MPVGSRGGGGGFRGGGFRGGGFRGGGFRGSRSYGGMHSRRMGHRYIGPRRHHRPLPGIWWGPRYRYRWWRPRMGYWGWGPYWGPPWFWFSGISGLVVLLVIGSLVLLPLAGVFLSSIESSGGPNITLETISVGNPITFDDGTTDLHYNDYWYRGARLSASSTIQYNCSVVSGGTAHFFITDRQNFNGWYEFESWSFARDLGEQTNVDGTFTVPSEGDWLIVAANELNNNFIRVDCLVTFTQATVVSSQPAFSILASPWFVLGGIFAAIIIVGGVGILIGVWWRGRQGPPGEKKTDLPEGRSAPVRSRPDSLWDAGEERAKMSSKGYICRSCGTNIEPGELFCYNCGASLEP